MFRLELGLGSDQGQGVRRGGEGQGEELDGVFCLSKSP